MRYCSHVMLKPSMMVEFVVRQRPFGPDCLSDIVNWVSSWCSNRMEDVVETILTVCRAGGYCCDSLELNNQLRKTGT